MTREQLNALKFLSNNHVRSQGLDFDKYDVYCFLADEGYAYFATGREQDMSYNYFCISEKGKAFLVEARNSKLNFVVAFATLVIAVITLVVTCVK